MMAFDRRDRRRPGVDAPCARSSAFRRAVGQKRANDRTGAASLRAESQVKHSSVAHCPASRTAPTGVGSTVHM